MKNILSILSISFLLLTVSCSSDDDNSYQNSALDGKWYLESVQCFCGWPENPKFNENELTFDLSTSKVTVRNGSNTSNIADNGVYDYDLNSKNTIIINQIEYLYSLDAKGSLSLFTDPYPQMADDEATFIYSRTKELK